MATAAFRGHQQQSGRYPQAANETVSILLSLSPRFSESRTHVILPCLQREFLSSAVQKVLTKMYAENCFGEGGCFSLPAKWKWSALETDQAHEVPQCGMNPFANLYLCAKALGWMNEHRHCLQGWTRTLPAILKGLFSYSVYIIFPNIM